MAAKKKAPAKGARQLGQYAGHWELIIHVVFTEPVDNETAVEIIESAVANADERIAHAEVVR